MTEYALEFDRLSKFAANLVPTNATRVDQFIRGLKPMIARDVKIVSVGGNSTYAQVLERVLTAEIWEDRIWKEGASKTEYLECKKCKKCHQGECRENASYSYGKEEHIKRNFLQKSQEGFKEKHRKDDNLVPARVFTLTKPKAEASTTVVSGQIFISGIDCHVLIDSGATHSFAAKRMVDRFNRTYEMHAKGFGTMLPIGEVVISRKWFRALSLRVDCRELFVDLIKLDVTDFDVILGMDWLVKYDATVD
ncbi:uncharacterized protein LOC133779189 [Humulus lupulus]|uniref:uncharacterized protein LOC133779189 n=1 Tax=Humulus lupulus TaxID=3486 RepID=UPI002B41212B|nr:uncharacterized protein LOC133779189 [Humulus lupulus]